MTITTSRKPRNLGFTLVELAIVLAVTGVMFVGLYRLLSGGNAQVKDSSTAAQQTQLVNAVKGYLASTNGANWMGASVGATGAANVASTNITLPLPPSASAADGATNTNCHSYMTSQDATGNLNSFCEFLPAGFSTSTVNAYGQGSAVQVQTGTITAPAKTPSTYSFMVVTTGGDVIPDADGGRISSEIGGDGGFIYTNPVCTTTASTTTACGSYGAWSATTTGAVPGFGFAATASGHVASRTYTSPDINSSLPWLARILMPGDTPASATTSPYYNTMKTTLFMGGQILYMGSNTSTTGGGNIDLQQGQIFDGASNGFALYLGANGNYLSSKALQNSLVYLDSKCTVDENTASAVGSGNFTADINANGDLNPLNVIGGLNWANGDYAGNKQNDCLSALQILGDANVVGMLQAVTLYAGTFIYQSSDIRLKTDILPIPHALDTIMQLKPVSFAFKSNRQKGLGFIAQDVEKIYPQLVSGGDPKAMKAVNYDGLIAPIVGAIQELKQQNDELRQQLKSYQLRQSELEGKIRDKQP